MNLEPIEEARLILAEILKRGIPWRDGDDNLDKRIESFLRRTRGSGPTVHDLGLKEGDEVTWRDDEHKIVWEIQGFYHAPDPVDGVVKAWAKLEGPYGARVTARPTRLVHT